MAKIKINGANLFYEGIGRGEPNIFHPGYTVAHDFWLDELSPRLRDHYRCIVMDCREAGDSEYTEQDCHIEQYADDVVVLAEALEIDRFQYVRYGMEEGIGNRLATVRKERINKLVLVAPIPSRGIKAPESFRESGRKLRAQPGRKEFVIKERRLTEPRASESAISRAGDRALSA